MNNRCFGFNEGVMRTNDYLDQLLYLFRNALERTQAQVFEVL